MYRRIAVIGAGFCGLAVAWHLSKRDQVTLYDTLDIGAGTSGMASGLLHPYVGVQSKLNWMGREGYAATVKLLNESQKVLGKPVVNMNKGIIRLALVQEQELNFRASAATYPDVEWLNADQIREKAPDAAYFPGIFITEGLTVYSSLYLEGLWKGCQQRGVAFEKKKISSLAEVDGYDLVIITAGALTQEIPELSALPLNQLKGQLLELKWPQNIPPLKYPLNSHVYLLMTENNHSCIVGGTYERGFTHAGPDIEKAKEELLPKLKVMYPPLKNPEVIACRAGIRSGAPNRLPFIKQMGPKHWVLAGMGSKGLLYHALMAEKLVSQV